MKWLGTITIALSFCLGGLSLAGQSNERVFKPNEVSSKARILRKVPPQYTEEARRHRVSGTIVVEVVLRASGEVSDIVVIKGLPYGLNDSAVRAAQAIEFEPAIKDDHKVSQYLRMEYGFRLY